MQRRSFVQLGLMASVLSTGAAHAQTSAQKYPAKPIKLVIGFPAGGPTDITFRVLAENAGKILGQSVVVDNKAGANGLLPALGLHGASPDGYTIAQVPISVVRLPYISKTSFDPINDLSYVINITGYEFGIVVPSKSPIKNWDDYVAWAKANAGRLTYGTSAAMGSPNITMSQIAQKYGIELLHAPYKGSAELMQAVLSGQIMSVADSTGFAPHVESGALRLINTWGAKRLPKFPNVPTLQELGINMVQNSPFGLAMAKGTPPEIAKRVHDAFKQAMEQENYIEILSRYDMLPIYMGSADYLKFMQATLVREQAVIEKLGFSKIA